MHTLNNKPMFIPLSYSQEGLWILDKAKGSLNYHIPLVFKYKGNLDLNKLELALREILMKHSTLRTVFKQDKNGDVYQEVLNANTWKLHCQNTPNIATKESLTAYVNKLSNIPFELHKDYMLRAYVLENEISYLVLIFHHISFDGWSEAIFIDELQKAYNLETTDKQECISNTTIIYYYLYIYQVNSLHYVRLK